MDHKTRVNLDRDYVESIIPITKTIKEMAKLCRCSEDKLRSFMRENGLYKYYCEEHNLKYNPESDSLVCSVCGDNFGVNKYHGIPYCKKHFLQMVRHGKILESTIYDRNEIRIDGDTAYIVMKNKNQENVGECSIDSEDVDKIKEYKWYLSFGYCVTKAIDSNSGIDIANVIFDDYKNRYDHINHTKLDNRKINLRAVTAQQNAMNMGKKNTNTSGVTGVKKERNVKTTKWIANITYNYNSIWLGSYETFDDAVDARLKGEIKYFGIYSPNYNPETNTIQLQYHSLTDDEDHTREYSLEGELLRCS